LRCHSPKYNQRSKPQKWVIPFRLKKRKKRKSPSSSSKLTDFQDPLLNVDINIDIDPDSDSAYGDEM
jgi:hypothetical protein